MTPHTLPVTPHPFFSPVVESILSCSPQVPESLFIDKTNYYHFLYALHVFCNAQYTDIYVADSYLVLSTSMYKYVIGLADGDGKLFVNKVRREPLLADFIDMFEQAEKKRLIRIYKTSDREVWSILGFQYNVIGEEIIIDRTGVYRVQGDLVLEVGVHRPLNLINDLVGAQARLLLDLLLRVLTEMRVTARVGTDDNIIVPIMVPAKDPKTAIKHSDTIRDMVVGRTATALYEKLKEIGLATHLRAALSWKAIIDVSGDYSNCDIHVSDGGFHHGYDAIPYVRGTVIISPRCSLGRSEGTLLEKMYKDLLQLYQSRTFEFTVGNHHIRMENAYSMMLRYRPKWQPLMLGDLIVEINVGQGWYHVTPKTTITIVHDEHGVTKLRFADKYRVRFRTLDLSETHDHERNAIALNLLDDFLS